MSIDFNAIEAQIASDIGAGIADGVNAGIGTLNISATVLAVTATWDGSEVVLMSDTSQLLPGFSFRLDVDGRWFLVESIVTDESVTISSQYGAAFPSGVTPSSFTNVALPAPASAQAVEDSLGASIGLAVRNALETFASDAEISGTTAGSDTIGPGVIS